MACDAASVKRLGRRTPRVARAGQNSGLARSKQRSPSACQRRVWLLDAATLALPERRASDCSVASVALSRCSSWGTRRGWSWRLNLRVSIPVQAAFENNQMARRALGVSAPRRPAPPRYRRAFIRVAEPARQRSIRSHPWPLGPVRVPCQRRLRARGRCSRGSGKIPKSILNGKFQRERPERRRPEAPRPRAARNASPHPPPAGG